MSYSPPHGSPSMDDYQPVDEGRGGEDHPQKNGSRRHRRQNQQLQPSSIGVPSQGHIQKTNHLDKQSKHQQQQQHSGTPTNPGNYRQNTNNSISLQLKVSDSSLSGYQNSHQHVKPQQPPAVTQGFPSKPNSLPNPQSEQIVQIQSAPQKNLPKLESKKSSSNTQKEERVIPSSPKYPEKTTNLGNHQSTNNSSLQQPSVKINDSSLTKQPQLTVPSQGYQPKPYDASFNQSSSQHPNEQVASIQAPLQQNKSPSNTKKEKAPKGDEADKDPPEKFNPTLPQEEQFSQQANFQANQKSVSEETDQNLDQKESHSQRVPLPVPDGYPPDRPPTSPSKLEPPKVPPSKCCCDCCDCCSSCSIL
ncbi:hypothetical protein COLO4_37772 [Corchorus olitorius]|uniref:Uncharacterized protein n=1 Tax=Corchorus olitorius TaxID=93759 RepID=A0A1R3FZE5_9ROSI|nr:hypothetical protein COLO4_37772 [Corchorus olitorius]